MRNSEWNREFPEVPDMVHQTVVSTLAGLEKQEGKKMKKLKRRTAIILAAAMVAVMGTTVAAAEIFKWNERATEVFEAEEEVRNELVLNQIAEEGRQEVSDNGLTIRAVQTIQDTHCFYALFEMSAEDAGIDLDGSLEMEYLMDYPGEESPFAYLGSGFVDNGNGGNPGSRYFEIYGTKQSEMEEDLDLGIHFTALCAQGEKAEDGEAILEGNWDFDLHVHPAEYLHYDIDREIQIAGCAVKVRSVELSPLSVEIVCEEAGIHSLEEAEGVSLDQTDTLHSLFVNGVKYEDGTVIEEEGFRCMHEGFDGAGNYVRSARFSHVIEPGKATALLVGDAMEPIEFK